jgi:hypothetical protein
MTLVSEHLEVHLKICLIYVYGEEKVVFVGRPNLIIFSPAFVHL